MEKMKNVENRTLEIVLAELNASVDAYNASNNPSERMDMASTHEKLVKEYNQLSLLNAYATFMKAEKPLVELAKTYYYDTISTKDAPHEEVVDGVRRMTVTRSVKNNDKKLDVLKFVEWTAERNKCVAHDKNWKSNTLKARNVVIGEWKKFFASNRDSHSMSIGKTKRALQDMFDSLVFVESETGKNGIIASGNIAKWVLAFANTRKDSKADGKVNITGNIMTNGTWNTLVLDALHKAVMGKDFDIVYGDPVDQEPEDKKADTKASAEA